MRACAARTSLMLAAGWTPIHTTSSVSKENNSMVTRPNTPSGHGVRARLRGRPARQVMRELLLLVTPTCMAAPWAGRYMP